MPNLQNLPEAPPGAFWRFDEVATNHGKESLGDRPLLEWESNAAGIEGARAFYGDEGVCNALNGTSLLVSYQGIARRITIAGKQPDKNLSDDEIDKQIAEAILKFRPGKKGEATPASKAARRAKDVADSLGDKGADAVASLLDRIKAKIAAGEMSVEELDSIEL